MCFRPRCIMPLFIIKHSSEQLFYQKKGEMRRILFILKGLPYPIDRDGLSVINYRLLKMASEDYWFDIISLSEESKETILGTRGISNRIARIMVLPDKISDSSSGRIFRLVARLFGKGTLPYDKLLRE